MGFRLFVLDEHINERVLQLPLAVADIFELLHSIKSKINNLTSMTTVPDQMMPDDAEQISLLQYPALAKLEEFNELELKMLDNQQHKKLVSIVHHVLH